MNNILKEFKKVPTFEEIANETLNPLYKIPLPNRDYSIARASQLLTRYDDPDFLNLQKENANNNLQQLSQINKNKFSQGLKNQLNKIATMQTEADAEEEQQDELNDALELLNKEAESERLKKIFEESKQPFSSDEALPHGVGASSEGRAAASSAAAAREEQEEERASSSKVAKKGRGRPATLADGVFKTGSFFDFSGTTSVTSRVMLRNRLNIELDDPILNEKGFNINDELRKAYNDILDNKTLLLPEVKKLIKSIRAKAIQDYNILNNIEQ